MRPDPTCYFTLDGHTPVPCDREIWLAWACVVGDARELGLTIVAGEHVVTEFPGFRLTGDGGLFRTHVYGPRCAGMVAWADDWEGARRNHGAMVAAVGRALATQDED